MVQSDQLNLTSGTELKLLLSPTTEAAVGLVPRAYFQLAILHVILAVGIQKKSHHWWSCDHLPLFLLAVHLLTNVWLYLSGGCCFMILVLFMYQIMST